MKYFTAIESTHTKIIQTQKIHNVSPLVQVAARSLTHDMFLFYITYTRPAQPTSKAGNTQTETGEKLFRDSSQ